MEMRGQCFSKSCGKPGNEKALETPVCQVPDTDRLAEMQKSPQLSRRSVLRI
jgi:hypothetical protein